MNKRRLKTLETPEIATAQGFHSLTLPLHEVWERDHIESIDKTMFGTSAVWVKIYEPSGKYTNEIECWRK